jgi:hypothetical protein
MSYDQFYLSKAEDLFIKNNQIIDYERHDTIIGWIHSNFYGISICPFCNSSVIRADYFDEEADDWLYTGEYAFVVECQNCGFWQSYWAGVQETPGDDEWEGHMSKLSEFPEDIPNGCLQECAQYLKTHPNYWNEIKPSSLERLIADIFRANYQNSEVFHVGQPNDGGIDVLFVDSGKKRWLIQVKRRGSPNATEGVSTLRNLLGVLLLRSTKYGIVVSTADHFSYWAFKAKEKARILGYTIELIDKGKLKRLIEPLLPNRQWVRLIEKRRPEWIPVLFEKMPDRRQLTIEQYMQRIATHGYTS